MTLRDYQERAVQDLYAYLRDNEGFPCVVLPTGGGKSHIVAHICKDVLTKCPDFRVLMLTHVKELIAQNASKMRELWPNAPLGIYSAGLRRKELGEAITFAGIQSLRGKADEIGHIDVIIIDEAHLVSHEETGGYRELITALRATNPRLKCIGLTATPWRLGHGLITEKPAIFDDLLESVTIEELISKGYLSTLRSKSTREHFDLTGVGKRGGEYIESELAKAVDTNDKNQAIVDEIIARAGDRKAWLVFCASVEHANHITDVLLSRGVLSVCLTGETPQGERDKFIAAFRRGGLRCVVNVGVLTTGFDYPDIDLVAMLRPTLSPALYVQQVGRGLRLKSHTDHCMVLDFAGNIETHGPITCVREPKKGGKKEGDPPVKTCDQCGELVALSVRVCPDCGFRFPAVQIAVAEKPDDADIMGKDLSRTRSVIAWRVSVHTSKGSGKSMVRIDYALSESKDRVSEYLCLTHGGFAQVKAERLLAQLATACRVDLRPEFELAFIADTLDASEAPSEIEYEKEGEFFRVKKRTWKPKASNPKASTEEDDDPIPF